MDMNFKTENIHVCCKIWHVFITPETFPALVNWEKDET